MTIVDPMAFFGDSGIRELRVTKAEAAALRRAQAIVEKAHDLLTDTLGDGHYDLADSMSLCETTESLRLLASNEIGWAGW